MVTHCDQTSYGAYPGMYRHYEQTMKVEIVNSHVVRPPALMAEVIKIRTTLSTLSTLKDMNGGLMRVNTSLTSETCSSA